MPAHEASGIGGRSYGRIALYLQEVSLARSVLHYNNSIRLETLRFFLVKINIVAIITEVKNSSRFFLRNRISSKPKHKKDGKKAQKATIENRLRPETHVCVCVCLRVCVFWDSGWAVCVAASRPTLVAPQASSGVPLTPNWQRSLLKPYSCMGPFEEGLGLVSGFPA